MRRVLESVNPTYGAQKRQAALDGRTRLLLRPSHDSAPAFVSHGVVIEPVVDAASAGGGFDHASDVGRAIALCRRLCGLALCRRACGLSVRYFAEQACLLAARASTDATGSA